MQVNKTQIEIMHAGALFRLITPEIMAHMTGMSRSTFDHEMPLLAKHGYLYRVVSEREVLDKSYVAYMLDTAGARIVSEVYGIPRTLLRKKKPKVKGQNETWKDHELMNARSMAAIYTGTQAVFEKVWRVPKVSGTMWIDGEAHQKSIKPDYAFTLEPDGYEPLVHYHEADTGTEPIERSDLIYQQSILQKLLVYLSALKSGQDFTVTVVTSSKARVENMIGTLWPILAKEGGDEFADNLMINDIGTLLKDPINTWCNFKGEHCPLVGESDV